MRSDRSVVAWALVIVGSALTASLPFLFFRYALGTWLPPVLPQVESDAIYYLVQIRAVVAGHFSIGNPYIREFADASFPGLILPIWMAAAPGLLGLGMNALFAFNTFFYVVLTGALLYALCLRVTEERPWLSAVCAVFGVASLHNLLIRPAVMQTVYPVYAAFLLALVAVMQKPHSGRRYVWLGIATAVSFYLYPYLWMIAFTMLGLVFLRSLWMRDGKTVRNFLLMGAGVGVACIPQILTLVSLFHDPLAAELAARTELVATRVVLPIVFFNYKYCLLIAAGLLLLRTRRSLTTPESLLLLFSAATFIVAVSNVITGKEIDFDTHPLWLSFLTNAVGIAILTHAVRGAKATAERAVLGFLLAALFLTTASRTFIRFNAIPYARGAALAAQSRSVQEYEPVLRFLNESDVRDAVILAPGGIGDYVPLYTRNYLLYMHRAGLNTISNDELLERFLTYYVDHVDENFLRSEFDGFAGAGPVRQAMHRNAYGGSVQAIDLIGGDAFIRAALARHREISVNYATQLKKFGATHAITDARSERNPRVPAGAKKVYEDKRFTVYAL